jgi:hypothetical protein
MAKSSARVPADSLVDLACRDGIDVRPTLVRALTDLYVQRPAHSSEEETQYVELVLGLIDSVDARTRAAVAAKLRQYPKAPLAVLDKLDRMTTNRPEQARNSEDLLELFFSSAPDERRLILTNLDVVSDPASRRQVLPEGEMVRRLERAALRRNPSEFSRILSRALNVGGSLAERITLDNSGEPVVVAAKTLGMRIEVLQRILLFLNPAVGQSVQRIFELCRLYSELKPVAAERMLAIWQSSGPQSDSRHEPVYWDGDRRSSRSFGPQNNANGPQNNAKHRTRPPRARINER